MAGILEMAAVIAAVVSGFSAASARAQTVAADAASRCKALGSAEFSGTVDAPTQVMAAQLVNAVGDSPAYCQVQGYITPNVGFELRLPASDWNGKSFQAGCGGWCGAVLGPYFEHACDAPLRKGYACIATDSGHKSTLGDLKWAYNNIQAELDYAYRSTHVTALAGKAIAEHYYGRAPSRSYFMGCSGGGREGMVEAQRFPWDFDGIISGAPAINVTSGVMRLLWAAVAPLGKDGESILSRADVQLVHDAAIAKCDMDDGAKDGIIGNPPACKFDPSELLCKLGQKAGCLTRAQVQAVKKIYAGPMTSNGENIYTGGDVPGAELEWDFNPEYWAELFRYGAFLPDPGPSWKARDFDFDRDYKRLGMMESLYTGSNPDLRKFKARGGKLIAYHGWADHLQPGLNTIDYYETVEKTMGGPAVTQDFFRLFMLPGVGHCSGGAGADAIDYLSYLEAWVERGQAPDMMLSAHLKPGTDITKFPLEPAAVTFTRPVYPYPVQAKYKGSGDSNSATNFGPVEPH